MMAGGDSERMTGETGDRSLFCEPAHRFSAGMSTQGSEGGYCSSCFRVRVFASAALPFA
ncbi:hypothetical protein AMECASPLE_001890, partial [Ameca splendens]